ncbi:hypothetical protein ACKWTF_000525 [Chironomus riparius]
MCSYSEQDYKLALEESFNFSSFKSEEQKIATECIASEKYKNIIISMATQSGKSLCYQLPRTALQRSGVVLVISPNISLITNQVAYLSDLRIPVTSLTGITPRLVRRDLIDRLEDSKANPYQFLYLTPEMLIKGSESIRFLIETMMADGDISLIVMDDAHMIIDTGIEFRHCFSEMRNIRKMFPDIPWVALTTASLESIKMIGIALNMEDPKIIKGPSTRKNIFYDVRKFPVNSSIKELIEDLIESDEKQEKHVTKKIYDSGIIYCHMNQEADRIAEELCESGISSESFYGTKNECNLILKNWKDGKFPVLVATEQSFGLGINRNPLKYVVHMTSPKNLRAFYQQSGRIDTSPGYSRLVYPPNGFVTKEMKEYATHTGCRHQYIANFFGDEENEPCGNNCDNCVTKERLDRKGKSSDGSKSLEVKRKSF